MEISVITCTARGKDGLSLVEKALKRQSFTGFEWIIQNKSEPLDGCVWSLNRDYNTAIKRCKGDIIVSWQDYTYACPDTLERFYNHWVSNNHILVSAVGNKYLDDTFMVETWRDPRIRRDNGTFYPCYFNDIEFNLCMIPKDAIYSVGGFDEELDMFYGMDGYSVVDRLNMIGQYDFYLDQSIQSYSLEHGRPDQWEEKNAIHGPYNMRRVTYQNNPVLSYLANPRKTGT